MNYTLIVTYFCKEVNSKYKAEGILALSRDLVALVKHGTAGCRSHAAHRQINANVDERTFGKLAVVLGVTQLCRGIGIDRAGERCLCRDRKEILDGKITAGVMTARFLRTDVAVLVVILGGTFVICVACRHAFIDVALARAVADVSKARERPIDAEFHSDTRKMLNEIGETVLKRHVKLVLVHRVCKLEGNELLYIGVQVTS